MGFIDDYFRNFPRNKVEEILELRQSGVSTLNILLKAIGSKERLHEEMRNNAIPLHMPRILKNMETNTEEYYERLNRGVKSLDEFIIKQSTTLARPKQVKIQTGEDLALFVNEATVSSGINTGLLFIFGLLRVIPSLFKQLGEKANITKDKLIDLLKAKKTLTLLKKMMMLNIPSLLTLRTILWMNEHTQDSTAKNKFEDFCECYDLNSLQDKDKYFSQILPSTVPSSILFNPKHFKLDAAEGLSFNESGVAYYDLAKDLYKKEDAAIGCPAIWSKLPYPEEKDPTKALLNYVGEIIRLIPEGTFTQWITAPLITPQEIQRNIN
jgi:hypothetical protein